ncbi:MAG: hypothetical protein ACREUH_08065, partial [Burkholderiales bacterium]
VAAALAAALAGCGAAPLEYHRADDIKPGPGMISGEKGEFVYTLGGKPAPAAAPAAATGEAEEFERWKRSAAGTDEYREFQDWREWRDWKRRNAR